MGQLFPHLFQVMSAKVDVMPGPAAFSSSEKAFARSSSKAEDELVRVLFSVISPPLFCMVWELLVRALKSASSSALSPACMLMLLSVSSWRHRLPLDMLIEASDSISESDSLATDFRFLPVGQLPCKGSLALSCWQYIRSWIPVSLLILSLRLASALWICGSESFHYCRFSAKLLGFVPRWSGKF